MFTRSTLIHDFLDVAIMINQYYNTSKIPKFIKNRVVRKNTTRVLDSVDHIGIHMITFPLLLEYISFIGLTYPPKGKYGHIRYIKSTDLADDIVAKFVYEFKQYKKVYVVEVHVVYNREAGVSYIHLNCKNNPHQFSFMIGTDDPTKNVPVELVYDPKYIHLDHIPFDVSYESTIITNTFLEIVLEDIKSFLKEKINLFAERRTL